MKTPNRGFIVPLLLIVIAALLVGGGYLYTQNQRQVESAASITPATSTPQSTSTSSKTVNWKTYKNAKYGFEFKYPSSWTFTESDLNSPSASGNVANIEFSGSVEMLDNTSRELVEKKLLAVSVNPHPQYKTIASLQAGLEQTNTDADLPNQVASDFLQLKNINGLRYMYGSSDGSSSLVADILSGAPLVDINLGLEGYIAQRHRINSEETQTDEQLFDTILSSFKLTNYKATVCSDTQHSCPCATGNYCLARGAMCINPASACPAQ